MPKASSMKSARLRSPLIAVSLCAVLLVPGVQAEEWWPDKPGAGVSLSQSLSEDLWLGFNLSTPLDGELYRARLSSLGGDSGEWELTNLNSALGWQFTPELSVQAGMDLQQAQPREQYKPRALDSERPDSATAMAPQGREESWQHGLNLGMRYSLSAQTSLDWQYRSLAGSSLQAMGKGSDSPLFWHDGQLGSSTSLGFTHQAAQRWTLLGQYTRFAWNELDLNDSDDETPHLADDYRDSWALMLGSEYRFDPQWTVRGGLRFSEGLSSSQHRDSTSLALGAAYRSSNRLSLEMAYTHELMRQQSLSLDNDALRASERSDSLSNGHSFGLGLRYAF